MMTFKKLNKPHSAKFKTPPTMRLPVRIQRSKIYIPIYSRETCTMKITRIEIIPLVRSLEEAFEGGTYRIVNRYTLVTRVYTDVGIVGEVFGGDEDQRQDLVVQVVRDHFE